MLLLLFLNNLLFYISYLHLTGIVFIFLQIPFIIFEFRNQIAFYFHWWMEKLKKYKLVFKKMYIFDYKK